MADDFQSKAAEVMKRVLTVGVGAFFLTEESLRGLISDFKLPKEVLTALFESAQKTRDEFLKTLSKELMAQVIEKVDLKALAEELLEKNKLEIQCEINFRKKNK